MNLSDFDYQLSTELIAQYPLPERDSSKLLVLRRKTGELEHRIFRDVPGYFHEGDVLVLNDTKVIPVRLKGNKTSGGKVELTLLRETGINVWEALVSGIREGTVHINEKIIANVSRVSGSLSEQPGATERVASVDQEPGAYLILVSQFGETPAAGSTYSLAVRPVIGTDSDGDRLSDWWEKTHFGTLVQNGSGDADNDGLADRAEHERGTHPFVADTGGDGMPDGWEAAYRLDPLANDAAGDPDKDGKTNLEEYRDGTDPNPRKAASWLPLLLD